MGRRVCLVMLLASGCATNQGANRLIGRATEPRFESLETILSASSRWECVRGLTAIPATVIDVGVFKNVPYQSFSNGSVELNGYGDPSNLVALEAGTKSDDAALKACLVRFIAAQSLFASDRSRIESFDATPRATTEGGLTVETTPASADDAFGAWWISAELTEQVSGAAANEAELAQVSTTQSGWNASPMVTSGPTGTYSSPASRSSYRRSVGGPVFVHGYTKKNGTYVQSHSRRR